MENKGRILCYSQHVIYLNNLFPRCKDVLIDAVINNPWIIALVLTCSSLSSFGRPSFCRTYVKTFSLYSTLPGKMVREQIGPTVILFDRATRLPVLEFGQYLCATLESLMRCSYSNTSRQVSLYSMNQELNSLL